MEVKDNDINELITKLVSNFKDYNNNLQNRIKVDNIFMGFDDQISKNFNKFVTLSENRYKLVKSGVRIGNIINYQKNKYKKLNQSIKNDKIYSSKTIEHEKNKLYQSAVTIKNREILKIREQLNSRLKKYRTNNNKYGNFLNERKKIFSKTRSNFGISRNNKKIKINALNKKKSKIVNNDNKKFLENIINEDCNNFIGGMTKYKNFLQKMRTLSEENTGKPIKINDKTNFNNVENVIKTDKFKFLSYTENEPENTIIVEKKDINFDLLSIQKLKLDHDRKNHVYWKNNYSQKNIQNENYFDEIPNLKTIHKEFSNTAKIVKDEAENGVQYDKNFSTKIKFFNNHFNNNSKIEDYNECEKKIKKRFFMLKKNLSENMGAKKISFMKKNKTKIENMRPEIEIIRRQFQTIYDTKKTQWEKEDELKKIKKNRQKRALSEIDKFVLTSS